MSKKFPSTWIFEEKFWSVVGDSQCHFRISSTPFEDKNSLPSVSSFQEPLLYTDDYLKDLDLSLSSN